MFGSATRRMWVLSVGFVALFALWTVTEAGGERVTVAFADWAQAVGAAIATAACVWRARREQGRQRAGWAVLAGAAASWALGQCVWSVYEVFLHRPAPSGSVADLLFLMSYPLLFGGITLLTRRAGTRHWHLLLDGLLLTLSVVVLTWHWIFEPMVAGGELDLPTLSALSYPLGDVMLVAAISRVLMDGGARRALAVMPVLLGPRIFTDGVYAVLVAKGTYVTGELADIGWLISHLVLAMGAVAAPRSTVAPGDTIPSPWVQAVPYVPLVAALPFVVYELSGAHELPDLYIGVVVGMIAVAVVRQYVSLLENAALSRQLDAKVNERTAELSRREAWNHSVVASISDTLLVVRSSGWVDYCSPSVTELIQVRPEDVEGRSVFELVHPQDRQRVNVLFTELAADAGATGQVELRLRSRGGEYRHVQAVGSTVRTTEGPHSVLFSLRDITVRRRLEDELRQRALYDALTGLANRALFLDRTEHALAAAGRTGEPCGVIFLDLDNFKDVNDSLGHAAGDHLLHTVASRLNAAVRPGDTVARLGGDEFAVLLEACVPQTALAAAERMLEALSGPTEVAGRVVYLSASVGVAVSTCGATADELLRDADAAMYAAKAGGKGAVRSFVPAMRAEALERLDLEHRLRAAIEAGELEVHYQPVVDLAAGVPVGAEALVRWRRQDGTLIPPADFIPLAEDTGLIVPLGSFVLNEAVTEAARWGSIDTVSGMPLSVSVNVSVKQLLAPGLADDVRQALERSGLDPSLLTLEVTESLLTNGDTVVACLDELKALGVRLAIDDFGTGYSSLARLREMPFDVVKIDRSFLTSLVDEQGRRFLAKLVELGSSLGLTTLAEGVEEFAEWNLLMRSGCQLGQGYLFSRPVPAVDVRAFLASSIDPMNDPVDSAACPTASPVPTWSTSPASPASN